MKNLIASITASLLITGCAIFPSYFDQNEQARIADLVELTSSDSVCAKDTIAQYTADLNARTGWLVTYGNSLPNNENLTEMYKSLHSMTDEFAKRYETSKPSNFYCKAKIKNINEGASKTLAVSGKRPRP